MSKYQFISLGLLLSGSALLLQLTTLKTKPTPPSTPIPLVQSLEPLGVDMKDQRTLVVNFVSTIFEYVDRYVRSGCSDVASPDFFPRTPKLKVTYRGGAFPLEIWTQLRFAVRKKAPSVMLVAYDEDVKDTYLIDITDVEATQPLASIKYHYSALFTFLSDDLDPYGLSDTSDFPPKQRPERSSTQTGTARVAFTRGYDPTTATLSKGTFHHEYEYDEGLRVGSDAVKRSVLSAIRDFELTLPEDLRVIDPKVEVRRLSVELYDYSRHSNTDPNVIVVKINTQQDLTGVGRRYLLEKNQVGLWSVVDYKNIFWTDFGPPRYICPEP
ncbi:MAG: hypothetical protein ABL899_03160 [Nitrospira sp.]